MPISDVIWFTYGLESLSKTVHGAQKYLTAKVLGIDYGSYHAFVYCLTVRCTTISYPMNRRNTGGNRESLFARIDLLSAIYNGSSET